MRAGGNLVLSVVAVVMWALRDLEEATGASVGWLLAVMVASMLVLGGCDPRGGGDPRDAPGCALNAFRCDGDVLQICQIDAAARRKTWWDVHNCVEFGHDVGKPFACVEPGQGAPAECAEVAANGAVEADGEDDAGEAASCALNEWRCQDGVVQGCAPAADGHGNAWWDVWDCAGRSNQVGRAMTCIESDGGVSAYCEYVAVDGGVAHE